MLENDLVGVGVGPTNLSLASLIETARVSGLAHFQSKFSRKEPRHPVAFRPAVPRNINADRVLP
jgi:lysine/ornithine N-monooxygenase